MSSNRRDSVARSIRRYAFAFASFLLFAWPVRATIRYSISLEQRAEHLAVIEVTIPEVEKEITIQIPAWNALYQIRDFAKNIRELRAFDAGGKPLELVKLDKQTWRIRMTGGRGTVSVRYLVEWNEPGAFSSQINSNHAFLNLATLLVYSPSRRHEGVVLSMTGLPEGWRVAAALETRSSDREFKAKNYDALVDAPVEAGEFDDFRFDVQSRAGNARIRVVAHASPKLDDAARGQLTEMLRRIVSYQITLMRDVPFPEFMFLYHFGAAAEGGGGGMEHANSTAIHTGSIQFAAGVTAHEFFHLWNVKRIRAKTLEPVDYSGENWTRSLWFAEGVTSTYGSYTLVRSGLWTAQQFYNDLGGQVTALQRRPARMWKSVEEASLDAWLEKYGDYSRPEYSISYYNKGQLLGVLLDILIRDATDNRKSLDDVLRDLNMNFAQKGLFYDETTDLRATAERIAGRKLGDFFNKYVAGTDELPFKEMLALAGMKAETQGVSMADLGFRVERPVAQSRVIQVARGSDAERAGVREGDSLVALNGEPAPSNLQRWLRQQKPGDLVRVTLRRGGADREVEIKLGEQSSQSWTVTEDASAGEKARRIREGILTGKPD